MPDLEKHLFEALSLEASRNIVFSIQTIVEATKKSTIIEEPSRRSFMTALLIQQADLLHELVGFMLVKGTPPKSKASKELKLLAALTAHFGSNDVPRPYPEARKMLARLGHEVPETLIKED